MTIKDVRIQYKNETRLLPDGSMKSLSDNPLPCALDTEVSAYVTWLEKKIIGKQMDDFKFRIMRARQEAKKKF